MVSVMTGRRRNIPAKWKYCDKRSTSVFNQWKSSVKITEKERNAWINRIDHWIAFRVAGIMEKSHRKYYGECASFIAALGEVQ